MLHNCPQHWEAHLLLNTLWVFLAPPLRRVEDAIVQGMCDVVGLPQLPALQREQAVLQHRHMAPYGTAASSCTGACQVGFGVREKPAFVGGLRRAPVSCWLKAVNGPVLKHGPRSPTCTRVGGWKTRERKETDWWEGLQETDWRVGLHVHAPCLKLLQCPLLGRMIFCYWVWLGLCLLRVTHRQAVSLSCIRP